MACLHIINFAHGALLSAALFAAFFAYQKLGLDPYLAVFLLAPLFFALGYALQRFVIGPAVPWRRPQHAPGDAWPRRLIENALLYAFRADTRTIDLPYSFKIDRSWLHLPLGAAADFLRRRFRRRAWCCGSS